MAAFPRRKLKMISVWDLFNFWYSFSLTMGSGQLEFRTQKQAKYFVHNLWTFLLICWIVSKIFKGFSKWILNHDSAIWLCVRGLSFNQVKLVPNLGKILWSLIKNFMAEVQLYLHQKVGSEKETNIPGQKMVRFLTSCPIKRNY